MTTQFDMSGRQTASESDAKTDIFSGIMSAWFVSKKI